MTNSKPIPFFDCVESAFERSKSLLWPFKKSVWLKLFILYLLTGSCASLPGGGGNTQKEEPKEIKVTSLLEIEKAKTPEVIQLVNMVNTLQILWNEKKSLVMGLAVAAFAGLILLGLFFIYISSRLKFVLIQSLSTGSVRIKEFWTSTRHLGTSYFRFRMWALVLLLLSGIPVLTYFIDWTGNPDRSWTTLIGVVVLLVLGILLVLLLNWAIDSVIPIVMLGKNQRFLLSLKTLGWGIKKYFGSVILSSILYLVFSLAVYIVALIGYMIVSLIMGIPIGLLLVYLWGLVMSLGPIFKVCAITILAIVGLLLILFWLLLFIVPIQTLLTYTRMNVIRGHANHLQNEL